MGNIEYQKPVIPKILWLLLAVSLISLVVASWVVWSVRSKTLATNQLPIYAQVPDFTLTERSGRAFGLNDLRGKIWLADLIFTNCAGSCPVMTERMAQLQQVLFDQLDVKLVSISVDPSRDTPEILAKYADVHGADKERWFFLTGPYDEIVRIANQGFHLSVGQLPTEDTVNKDLGPITHSIKFALVDRRGRVRGYYDGTDKAAIAALIRDIKILNQIQDAT
jgi:protein SCO1/2